MRVVMWKGVCTTLDLLVTWASQYFIDSGATLLIFLQSRTSENWICGQEWKIQISQPCFWMILFKTRYYHHLFRSIRTFTFLLLKQFTNKICLTHLLDKFGIHRIQNTHRFQETPITALSRTVLHLLFVNNVIVTFRRLWSCISRRRRGKCWSVMSYLLSHTQSNNYWVRSLHSYFGEPSQNNQPIISGSLSEPIRGNPGLDTVFRSRPWKQTDPFGLEIVLSRRNVLDWENWHSLSTKKCS